MEFTQHVLLVIGGGPVTPPPRLGDRRPDLVIAADSGFDAALAVGLEPDLLIGDLDSISPAGLAWAADHAVEIETHSPDKDDTDTALALRAVVARGCRHLTLLSPAGTDRFDHLLGTLAALGEPGLGSCESITAWVGSTAVHVVHEGHRLSIAVPVGTVFSLLAAHGPCTGVTLDGARWPLAGADLSPASTRGISNVATESTINVSVITGVLSIIVPAEIS